MKMKNEILKTFLEHHIPDRKDLEGIVRFSQNIRVGEGIVNSEYPNIRMSIRLETNQMFEIFYSTEIEGKKGEEFYDALYTFFGYAGAPDYACGNCNELVNKVLQQYGKQVKGGFLSRLTYKRKVTDNTRKGLNFPEMKGFKVGIGFESELDIDKLSKVVSELGLTMSYKNVTDVVRNKELKKHFATDFYGNRYDGDLILKYKVYTVKKPRKILPDKKIAIFYNRFETVEGPVFHPYTFNNTVNIFDMDLGMGLIKKYDPEIEKKLKRE